MYWNNPIETIIYPSDSDIIFKSQHSGRHCLFYDPAVDKNHIANNQTLQDLSSWANEKIAKFGKDSFLNNAENHYEIANLIKLNLWVHDLSKRGSIKPMLLTYTGKPKYNFENISGTGASRLRAMERIPSMLTVSAFITTSEMFRSKFSHLEEVVSFNQLAKICQAEPNQNFLFRLTNKDAAYGIDWYEYNSSKTATITPGESDCVIAMSKYLDQNPDLVFTPLWFDQQIDWNIN